MVAKKNFIKTMALVVTCMLCLNSEGMLWAYEQDSERREGEKLELRVGYVAGLTRLPLVISHANDQGSFENVNIVLDGFHSWTALEAAVRAELVDAAVMTVPITLVMAGENVPISIVGSMSKGGSRLMVTNGKSFNDLKGKIIGVPGLDSSENLLLYSALDDSDLILGKDIRAIEAGSRRCVDFLHAGTVDAVFPPEPYPTIIENEKIGYELGEAKSLINNDICNVIIVHNEVIDQYEDAISEWLASIEKAVDTINDDRRNTGGRQVAIAQQQYFEYDPEVVMKVLENSNKTITYTIDPPTKEELNKFYNVASEMNLISVSVDFDTLLKTDIAQMAGKKQQPDKRKRKRK
ncbi:MAG: ABC transporter substrate-binding protein [Candidatus Omnitrophica bacterium]|nr:ABC transporter substrate-binding protein [Candidatus Omnitrophota bacterium]